MSGIMDLKLRPLKVNDLEYLTLNEVLGFWSQRIQRRSHESRHAIWQRTCWTGT